MIALMTLVGTLSGLIAWALEEIMYLVSIIWIPVCHISVGCLDFCTPIMGRSIQSGIGALIDSSLDCVLQTFAVPLAVGFERVCMPYFVEILQQIFNILG